MTATNAKDAAGHGSAASTRPRARSNPLLAGTRLSAIAAWTVLCYLIYAALRLGARGTRAKRGIAIAWSRRWFRGLLRIAGVAVRHRGDLPSPPAMIAPNHVGYLDIAVLGAVCGTFFVSKADVIDIPLLGRLFTYAEQIAVSRKHTRSVRDANAQVMQRLEQGFAVCVFLEGTSTGGGDVLPFHASLLQPAVDAGAPVVPAAVHWSAADPVVDIAEDVAYWRDHTFPKHLWRLFGLQRLSVEIAFGRPLPAGGRDRKQLAEEARRSVVRMLNVLRGLPTDAQEDTADYRR